MNDELLNGLRIALDNEVNGEKIYEQIALESSDEFTRNVFNLLAKDEIKHVEVIKEYIENISNGKSIIPKLEKKEKNKKFFGMNLVDFMEKVSLSEGDFKGYDQGIELETKSIDFYSDMLKKAESNETKEFFSFLIEQEKGHKEALEKAKGFLQDPEAGLKDIEGWMLDGGMM